MDLCEVGGLKKNSVHKVWNLKKLDHLSKEISKTVLTSSEKQIKLTICERSWGKEEVLLKRNLKPHLVVQNVGIEPEFVLLERYGKLKP